MPATLISIKPSGREKDPLTATKLPDLPARSGAPPKNLELF